ncbi:hypothetical protein HMPREF9946_02987 [Acetobacteraceae bacterium AT-5844]|nr:hypothetical protein HMPREF9946_02987 [Acetobacteraceae bacterium AT-5844]
MTAEITTAAPRYALDVPPLDEKDYFALQQAMMVPALRAGRKLLRNFAIVVLAGAVVGGLGGYFSARASLDAEAWIGSFRTGEGLALRGAEVFFAMTALIILTMLATTALIIVSRRASLRKLFRASVDLLSAHRLELGDDGILWRNGGRLTFVPWSRVSGLHKGRGILFIIVDKVSAFWVQEQALAALPDREGFMAYLTGRIPAKG